ncbi:uncharacterized protein HRG_11149 [Hirsutella rhossiliensis]|uniref:Uncharacterized protein n=1 Tax=Hirsutella rhossiliensis TaxID=111463 RepID=A0A9P8MJU4_9HYPO|nr:uncharacterized protein HRG_11149 [Hirsutella rhossiliensis]KAH0957658.1 hypothetical protein HRG_11149 [Hirsutella rhossiliensis]
MGVFNPNHKDPHKQGLVSLSSGSNVYTDVYLFCERLRMYKDLDSYALSQHYMSFLAGGALQWFMNELSIEQKDRLMNSDRDRSFRNDSRDRDRSYQRDHYQRDRGLDRRDRSNPSSDLRAKERRESRPKDPQRNERSGGYEKKVRFEKNYLASEDENKQDAPDDKKTAISDNDEASDKAQYLWEQSRALSQEILEPQPLEPPSHNAPFGYSYLRIKIKAAPTGPETEVCADSGCGNPLIDRKLLKSFEHTIEKKPPTPIAGISGSVRCTDWATFSFYAEGKRADGSSAGIAKFTSSAWVTTVEPGALLGNAFLKPYVGNIHYDKEVVQIGLLDDFDQRMRGIGLLRCSLMEISSDSFDNGHSGKSSSNSGLGPSNFCNDD